MDHFLELAMIYIFLMDALGIQIIIITKKNYDTGDTNLLGIGGSTIFQVK